MKKILFSVIAVTLMSTNLFAGIIGNITEVVVKDNGIITVSASDGAVTKTNNLVGDAESKKAMLAAVLTAKTSSATVRLVNGTATNGDYGWKSVIIQ